MTGLGRKSGGRGLLWLAIIGGFVILARLLVGRSIDGAGDVLMTFGFPASEILMIRGSAATAAVLAGAGLGLSGLCFQVLLRNPLASPWVLGVSSGAGFGLMTATWMSLAGGMLGGVGGLLLAFAGMPAAALGALLAIGVVWLLSRRLGTFDPVTLVLCGVIASATFGAGIMLLQHLVPNGVRGDLVSWMMGRIPEVSPGWLLATIGGLVIAGFGFGLRFASALDAACLTEDEARSVGVPVDRLRHGLLLSGGLLAAASVVLVGPIAFVGLLAPHAARLVVGPRHHLLVPGTVLAGAGVLLGADAVRQFIDLGGGRLPVGVVTSLVGGPVFLWLLLRRGSLS
ncbi:MAG: iron ABC transporter permease [Phycisphaerales bacterium]|nr:iron ABC transporter permease [Phycisphaerales bacterium]